MWPAADSAFVFHWAVPPTTVQLMRATHEVDYLAVMAMELTADCPVQTDG